MTLQRTLRATAIAVATGLLVGCTAVDHAVVATENGASRIFGGSNSPPPAPPPATVDLQSLSWQNLSPGRTDDPNVRMALIGTDSKTGATRVAIKVRAGEALPVYWQEAPQTYTVLNGTFVAEGIDGAGRPETVVQGPGTFARIPARMIERFRTKPGADAVMLVTVYGEWKPNFVDDAPHPTETQRAEN